MKFIIVACASFLSATMLLGFGSSHSSVETKISNQGTKLSIVFTVKANEGMEITQQAPWSLTIKDPQGLKRDSKGDIKITGYEEKVSGFTFEANAKEQVQEGDFEYVLKAFVCTEDKKRCFPQTHKGSVKWRLNNKNMNEILPRE